MTGVLIVEDSAVVREFLTYILGCDPQLSVVGTAGNGEEDRQPNAMKDRKPEGGLSDCIRSNGWRPTLVGRGEAICATVYVVSTSGTHGLQN